LGFVCAAEGIPWSADTLPIDVPDAITWEWSESNFPQPDVPKKGTAVLGLPDAVDFLAGKPELMKLWRQLVAHSRGEPAWCLTALSLWLLSVHSKVVDWMTAGGWFLHPPSQWISCAKDRLVSVRRILFLQGGENMPPNASLMFRKLANICGRNKEQADWAAEQHRRTINTPVHMFPLPDGTLCRRRWVDVQLQYLTGFTATVVGNMTRDLRLEGAADWWDSRYAWGPAGSSSNSKNTIDYVAERTGADLKMARANKKAVLASASDDYFPRILASLPCKHPRISTKNEAGLKNRALYAQDDESFLVSAFASVAMEKTINIDGVYAQQSPSDVAVWVQNHMFNHRMGLFFTSLDYSDYNTEHESWHLALLDALWAKAWLKYAGGHAYAREKAFASLWSAKAHLNSWVDFGSGPVRIQSGLFSGDRNTSRDNCILHAGYSNAMQLAAAEWMPSFYMRSLAMTGDDEDAAFRTWVHSLLYLTLHAYAGFELKITKQLVGDVALPTHEYLQRGLDTDSRPSRPLAAALSQLLSGNWYKTSYVWFDGIITSINSNCWELVTRGLPLATAQMVAAKILNRVMAVRNGDAWTKLEWWSFRTCGQYSPLWECTTEAPPKVPTGEEAVVGVPDAPGLLAWRRKNTRRFGDAITIAAMDRYMLSCSVEAYSSLYPRERNDYMHRAAAEVASSGGRRECCATGPACAPAIGEIRGLGCQWRFRAAARK
jgi:hypothetical protein